MQRDKFHLRQEAKAVLFFFCLVIACPHRVRAQTWPDADPAFKSLAWRTDSTGPRRFVSVHRRRAAIFGYSETGLEVSAYPVQIVRSYTATFRQQDSTNTIDVQTILPRNVHNQESV